jgi:hypothetical protein
MALSGGSRRRSETPAIEVEARSPWSSSSSKPRKKVGDALTATTNCQNCFLGVKFTDGLEVVGKSANPQPTTAAA